MSDPYIGEIRIFAGNFPPAGWMFCDGTQLSIAENDPLFEVIGTTYGGDGQENFNLPDLRGRLPIHMGQGPGLTQNYTIGEALGVESVTLTTQQIPLHNHAFMASTASGSSTPQGNIPASPPVAKLYRATTPSDPFPTNLVQPAGGSQPHDNHMPYIAIYYIISLYGIFPTPT